MGATPPHPTTEPYGADYARFIQRAQRVGTTVAVASCAFIVAYLLWTWSQPNRLAMLLLATGCALGALLILLLFPTRILKGHWRDIFFLACSAANIVVVAIFIALDGGLDESPLVAITFLPLIFTTVAYPPLPTLMIAVTIVVTFVVMGVAEGDAPQFTFVLGCSLAVAAALCATLSRLHHRQRAELARVSRVDPLTDCLNRRGLHERLAAELANADRHGHDLSLIVVDLDAFKAVNDRDGHAAGDALLVWTVQQITESVRPLDAVGRLGGDEFAVILPDTSGDEATEVAGRITVALAARTSASMGVAAYPIDGADARELHATADARLYDAKRGLEPVSR